MVVADALQEGAQQFEKQAATLKNKAFWKNMKMTIIITVVVLIIIIIVFRSYIPTGEIAKYSRPSCPSPLQCSLVERAVTRPKR